MHNIKKSAPIAFFAYKRPKHTRLALESLARNHGTESSELFIFCDGPKSVTDNTATDEVRQIARSQQWCGTVHIIESEYNLGLASSVIAGVTKLCEKFGRVIVLEDDLILSPYFLDYMNNALDLYEEDPRVMQVSGHMFPVKLPSDNQTLFLSFVTSWGWATWNRAWKHFDADMSSYHILSKSKELSDEFNLNGAYPYLSMLEAQLDGKIDSWAIRWNLSVFVKKGLVVYPRISLVKNIGFDGSGTHCAEINMVENESDHIQKIEVYPKLNDYDENSEDVSSILDYLRSQNKYEDRNLYSKVCKWISYNSQAYKSMKTSILDIFLSYIKKIQPKQLTSGTLDEELGMNIDISDSSMFDDKNLTRNRNCQLKIDIDSIISGRIVFEKEEAKVSIGQRVFMNGILISANEIKIGDDVMISWGVTITDHNSHSISFSERAKDVLDWKDGSKDWSTVKVATVRIHDKVWIGFNSIILKGITIGEGAVIGAGSVVTKDVSPWTIVAGNPARLIREIPEDER